MDIATLSNLESYAEAISSPIEAFGMTVFQFLIVFSFIPAKGGAKGYSSKMLLMGMLMFVTSYCLPTLRTLTVSAARDSYWALMILLAIPTAAAIALMYAMTLTTLFLPTVIAVRERRRHKLFAVACNSVAGLPGLWLVLAPSMGTCFYSSALPYLVTTLVTRTPQLVLFFMHFLNFWSLPVIWINQFPAIPLGFWLIALIWASFSETETVGQPKVAG